MEHGEKSWKKQTFCNQNISEEDLCSKSFRSRQDQRYEHKSERSSATVRFRSKMKRTKLVQLVQIF